MKINKQIEQLKRNLTDEGKRKLVAAIMGYDLVMQFNEATNKVNELNDDLVFYQKHLDERQGYLEKAFRQRDEANIRVEELEKELDNKTEWGKQLAECNILLGKSEARWIRKAVNFRDKIRINRIIHTALFITGLTLVLCYVAIREGWLV